MWLSYISCFVLRGPQLAADEPHYLLLGAVITFEAILHALVLEINNQDNFDNDGQGSIIQLFRRMMLFVYTNNPDKPNICPSLCPSTGYSLLEG